MFNIYPYLNENDLNLDYLLRKMKSLIEAMANFEHDEKFKLADPITFNIMTQYERGTIVLDSDGNAYLSLKPTVGNPLSDDEYWQEIFDFAVYVRTANSNLTLHIETGTTRATAVYAVDDWLLWDDVLYKVTAAIAIDDLLTIGTNITRFTVEQFCRAWVTYANALIQQYKNDIDASELAFTNNLQAQFDQVLAGVTVDSEVINARVGFDGTSYVNLGIAIRTQIENLHKDSLLTYGGMYTNVGASFTTCTNITAMERITTKPLFVPTGKSYVIEFNGSFDKVAQTVSTNGTTIARGMNFQDIGKNLKVMLCGGLYYRFCFAYSDDSEIHSDAVQYTIKEYNTPVPCVEIDTITGVKSVDEYFPMGMYHDLNGFPFYFMINADRVNMLPIKAPTYGKPSIYYNFGGNDSSLTSFDSDFSTELRQITWTDDAAKHFTQLVNSHLLNITLKNSNGIDMTNVKIAFFDTERYINMNDGKMDFQPVFIQGNTYPAIWVSSSTRCTSPWWLPVPDGANFINLICDLNYKMKITYVGDRYDPANTYIDHEFNNWHIGGGNAGVPYGANWFKVSIAYEDDSTITPSDVSDIIVYATKKPVKAGKILSILGDSITSFSQVGATSAGDGHTIADGTWTYAGNHCRYPQNNLLTDPHLTFWVHMMDVLGLRLGINDSWAGSRVSWDGVTESDDIGANKYIASPTRIGHLGENGTPDIILIHAGANDCGNNVTIGTFNTDDPRGYTDAQIAALDVSTFADAYRALLIRLIKAYPNARIVCTLFNRSKNNGNDKNKPYNDMIVTICDYFGVEYIDLRKSGINLYNLNTFLGDNAHPNALGMYLLGQEVIQKMVYDIP